MAIGIVCITCDSADCVDICQIDNAFWILLNKRSRSLRFFGWRCSFFVVLVIEIGVRVSQDIFNAAITKKNTYKQRSNIVRDFTPYV